MGWAVGCICLLNCVHIIYWHDRLRIFSPHSQIVTFAPVAFALNPRKKCEIVHCCRFNRAHYCIVHLRRNLALAVYSHPRAATSDVPVIAKFFIVRPAIESQSLFAALIFLSRCVFEDVSSMHGVPRRRQVFLHIFCVFDPSMNRGRHLRKHDEAKSLFATQAL